MSVKDFVSLLSDFQLDTGVPFELARNAFRAKADLPSPCSTLCLLVWELDFEPEFPDLTVDDEPFELDFAPDFEV